jgi:hypothetical protein
MDEKIILKRIEDLEDKMGFLSRNLLKKHHDEEYLKDEYRTFQEDVQDLEILYKNFEERFEELILQLSRMSDYYVGMIERKTQRLIKR